MQSKPANWQTWWRRRNRMDREAYVGAWRFSVTVSTWGRAQVCAEPDEVARCTAALDDAAVRHGFSVLAYCFMPDHLHLLIEGSDESDLAAFIKSFKQTTSFNYKQRIGRPLWQRSYYDHLIRSERDAENALAYILENPVRAGLVEEFAQYPFLGGAWVREMLVAT